MLWKIDNKIKRKNWTTYHRSYINKKQHRGSVFLQEISKKYKVPSRKLWQTLFLNDISEVPPANQAQPDTHLTTMILFEYYSKFKIGKFKKQI